jgi:hypothetical protein
MLAKETSAPVGTAKPPSNSIAMVTRQESNAADKTT